jgi:hypothetical protein
MDGSEKIKELLMPLFSGYDEKLVPADENLLSDFSKRALSRGVASQVVNELLEFYNVTNGVPCLDSFDFHRCDDDILFEWWDDRILWLAQRDFYTLRWLNNKYCLGDAGNNSFGIQFEFETLTGLLKCAFNEWYPDGI